mmetsp:Transcript_107036/g.332582  ORF Transcript_107036/g.332582 Transcript_107036/m.332582 type:complete len:1168 (+) Transcript_107036:124-3627(+)
MPPKSRALKKLEAGDIHDLYQGRDDTDSFAFGDEIMKCLMRKGFCVIGSGMSEPQFQEALAEVKQMSDVGRFNRPSDEVVEGLLGPGGSTRMVTVEVEPGSDDANSPIERLDSEMLSWATLLEPLTYPYFGFQLSTRSPGYLLEGGQGTEEPPAQFSAAECMKWLNVFQWHRIMCIFFLGPSAGTLEMQPFDDVSGGHTIPTYPGMWVLLRADMLHHRFSAQGVSYTLNSFLMQVNSDAELRRKQTNFPLCPIARSLDKWLTNAMKMMKETIETEEEMEQVATREVQRLSNQMYHRGQQVAIRGWACRVSGNASNTTFLQSALFTGVDCAEVVPFTRWDNEVYYRDEPQDGYVVRDTYTCQHGTFIEGIEMFDHKFFGLSLNETRGMDPNQRQMLEVCYEVCYSAGLKKPALMRTHMGVYTGGPAGELEWTWVPKMSESGALASTSGSPAILSNRLSYTFGMNGPNYLMDMEAASSMLALQQAVDAVLPQRPQCESALALGVDSILHPSGITRFCWAGLMSTRGRCLTFDHTADGYIRGEGTNGVFVNPLLNEVDGEFIMDDKPKVLAIASGIYANNSGKTASLTAPSGSHDQQLIAGAIKRAEISVLDVDGMDCDGKGSLLNDAVEVTALLKMYRSSGGEEMMAMGAVKSMWGNLKPASGMLAIHKTMLCHAFGQMLSTNHLMRVNPHMLTDDVPMYFATDHVPNRMNSAFYGASAKGIGGSNVHAIIWGKVDPAVVVLPKAKLAHEPIAYWPGGGGELEDDAKPNRSYTILGSWSGWADPQPMQSEGKGVHSFIVTLGEHAFERFQIWLDGDANRVLHPGSADAPRDVAVQGPDVSGDAEGMCWLMNGQPQYAAISLPQAQKALAEGSSEGAPAEDDLQYVQLNARDQGAPGDQYRVQLLVNGQYRMVTWEKVLEGPEDAPTPARGEVAKSKYFITANWNDWAFAEMSADSSEEGLFYLEAKLLRDTGGVFNIVRNQDMRQTIYPAIPYADSDSCNPVLGPDEHGRAYYWYVEGQAGDIVRIELQRAYEEGAVSLKMAWRKVGHETLPAELAFNASRSQFYTVGSTGKWKVRHKMTWNGTCYVYEYAIRIGNTENFQILMDGDWNLMLYPNAEDSPKDSTLRGPDELGQGLYWTIGLAEEERSGRFEVQLHVHGGRPRRVTWVRK